MKTCKFRRHSLTAASLLIAASLPQLPAQEEPAAATGAGAAEAELDAALESLGKAAESFVEAYNNRDAAAIAALFLPLGEIVASDGATLKGRDEIEDYHAEIFAGEAGPRMALEASSVAIIAPGAAVEDGVVHLTLAEDEPVRTIGYTATHFKQADGSWLIASTRNQQESTPPSEQIKPLHWLIGEWTLEGEDGFRIDMVIDLDERENYLVGEALVTDAEGDAQTTSTRIGWNPATSSVYWWIFDSEGGNASGQWARQDDGWVILTAGITADAESTASTQKLLRDGDTMVWIATERLLAGESQPDLVYRFVRRAPDPVSLLVAETPEEGGASGPAAGAGQD